MSVIVNLNGIPYIIPQTGETGWGDEVTNYLVALSTGVLSLEGGSFPLLSDINFGPNFGVLAPYFKSGAPNPAQSGILRLTNTESIGWRNSTNTGDLLLTVSGDSLLFNGLPIGGGSGSSPLVAKGDIYTFTTTNARLPVGVNGQVLTVDSSTPTGLRWLSGGGGGPGDGTVTGFSFTNANGFTGVVTNPTTTPNLTLSMATLPVSGGGTGQTTTLGSFNVLSPLIAKGDVLTHDGTNNIRLPSNPGKNFSLVNDGFGNLKWFLPTYAGQANLTTPVDMNNFPVTDLSPSGYGNYSITGTITDVANRPPGAVLPMSGTTSFMGAGGVGTDAFQTANNGGSAMFWRRFRIAGVWSSWRQEVLPDQVGQSGKALVTDGTQASWASFPGGGSVTNVSATGNNGVTTNVTNSTTVPNIIIGLGAITPTSVAATGNVTGANITGTASGTNTGDQNISLTGDATGTGSGTNTVIPVVLANVNSNPGSYNLASIVVDGKGRVTSASSGSLPSLTLVGDVTGSGALTSPITLTLPGITSSGTFNTVQVNTKGQVVAGSNAPYLTGNQNITISGDATGSGTTSIPLTLAGSGVAAGTYPFATITVDSKGRVTSAAGNTSVSSVSFTNSANISGSVANPTTTPAITADLINTTVVPGTYNAATITVDAKGRLTAAANGNVPNIYLTSNYSGVGVGVPPGGGGGGNTLFGVNAGASLTTGTFNVAIGDHAMDASANGSDNIAIGRDALSTLTGATRNIGIGTSALAANLNGFSVAIGYNAALAATGSNMTVLGTQAMESGGGNGSVALGYLAMRLAGNSAAANVAVGQSSLSVVTGAQNTGVGNSAGVNISSGINNVAIGNLAGTEGGTVNLTTQSNFVTIGNNSTTNAVIKVAWTVTSDERDKTEITPLELGLDFVKKMIPKQFKLMDRTTQEAITGLRYGFVSQDLLAAGDGVMVDAQDTENLKLKESMVVPVLVRAIQELSAQIDELKNRLSID